MSTRKPSVAGRWYPGDAEGLARAVDGHLAAAAASADPGFDPLVALVAPHAGLMYSGPVAAHAYRLLKDRAFETVVLVGPSHFVAFEGVAVYPGGFATPLGVAEFDSGCARALLDASPVVREAPAPHAGEHSLEMQLPFLRRVAPQARIVALLMGRQTSDTARTLGDALARALEGRRAMMVASTDLSHYHDAMTAARMDAIVADFVARLDAEGLADALRAEPGHACGGGPAVSVMRAARLLGARHACVLDYADSGDVSGDKSSVVGYLAAAIGVREEPFRDVLA
jgi:MEMO1 family protein